MGLRSGSREDAVPVGRDGEERSRTPRDAPLARRRPTESPSDVVAEALQLLVSLLSMTRNVSSAQTSSNSRRVGVEAGIVTGAHSLGRTRRPPAPPRSGSR